MAVIPKKDGLLPGWGRPGKPRGRVGFCAGLQRKAQDLAGQRRTRNDIRIREEVLADVYGKLNWNHICSGSKKADSYVR